jgi:hypothetical protein
MKANNLYKSTLAERKARRLANIASYDRNFGQNYNGNSQLKEHNYHTDAGIIEKYFIQMNVKKASKKHQRNIN